MNWLRKLFGLAIPIDVEWDDNTKPSVYDASSSPISTRSLERLLKVSRPGYKCHVHWEKL